MREMKWHVFNAKNEPLTWNGQAIEFDSKEDAKIFMSSCIYIWPNLINDDMRIEEKILYYDGGHINLTGCTVDEDGELVSSREWLN